MHKIVTIFLFMLKYAWVLILIDLRLGLRMDFFLFCPILDHDETYKLGYGPRTRVLTT